LWEKAPPALHASFRGGLNNSEGDSASRVRRFIIFKCAIMLQGQQLTVHSAKTSGDRGIPPACWCFSCWLTTTRENFFMLQLCGFKFEPFWCRLACLLPFSKSSSSRRALVLSCEFLKMLKAFDGAHLILNLTCL
jgi:hypothetical protein